MKKLFIKTIAAVLATLMILCCAGCGQEQSSSEARSSATGTTAAAQTDNILQTLHVSDPDGDSFAGVWEITKGVGKDLGDFRFLFDGRGKACLIIGTMGYIGNYTLSSQEGTDGKKVPVFSTQLMFGLNGAYTYAFSEDGNTLTLTATSTKKTSTLEKRAENFFIPDAVPDAKTDKELLGAWMGKNGEYYYFGADGVMYETIKGMSFTYYTYSAENGSVHAVYRMDGEIKQDLSYEISGNTLTFDGYSYERIPEDELV